ncbi:bis(5'-nucleosyl)-tetraphosphatase (symmetrical) YqeK [Vagococcus carniphilus]|uniref:bis(5'-nucleosyl)-tetraphosphatase (symmetrical) YqeK n=1 Tax=Vagococcus carniphilus TaxID=218144 RepID=UPI0028926BB9|nr:bis(5'-nucleosyl)-tetraphosphatase (symmetrical) YqeK [Vagococcus carniphilus]MDT2847923.1 bis(5'-nucleosyl)-tetraphosphatase (symmetrical) YqeK [Vagococcus carniphilus]
MIYSNQITTMTREELMEKVSEQMSDKRFQHVLRVEKKAIELAHKYGVDVEKASIAALTHDYAKERPDEEMISLIKSKGFSVELIEYGNAIWHGILGAYLVKEELDISDSTILKAIELHTTGSKDMSELDKVIYVADYIEDGRHFPVVEEARQVADVSLDLAVGLETKHTLLYLINNQNKIYPKTLETYNEWVVK